MGKFKSLIEDPPVDFNVVNGHFKPPAGTKPKVPEMQIVPRLVQLPIIESALRSTGTLVEQTKESNLLIRKSVTISISLFHYFLNVSSVLFVSVAQKWPGTVQFVDSQACKMLDTVTEKVPIITQPADQIWTAARFYLSERIQPIHQRLGEFYLLLRSGLVSLITQRASQVILNGLERFVDTCYRFVDFFVPPTAGEEVVLATDLKSKWFLTLRRGAALSIVIPRRLFLHFGHFLRRFSVQIRTVLDTRRTHVPVETEKEAANPKIANGSHQTHSSSAFRFLVVVIRLVNALRKPLLATMGLSPTANSVETVEKDVTKNHLSVDKSAPDDVSGNSEADEDDKTNGRKRFPTKKSRSAKSTSPSVTLRLSHF